MFYTYYKKYGNKIYIRYKNDDSNSAKSKVIDFYKPTLYVKSNNKSDDSGDTKLTIFGETVHPVQFESMSEAKEFASKYNSIPGMVSGNNRFDNQCIIELFEGKIPDYKPERIKVAKLDIEVDREDGFPEPAEAKWPITCSTIYNSEKQGFHVFILRINGQEWDHSKTEEEEVKDLNILDATHFDEEKDLIRAILDAFQNENFDLLTGWHSHEFDIIYLVNRAIQFFGEKYVTKKLSPFNKITRKNKKNKFGRTYEQIEIWGLPHLDYEEVYKKHTYIPRENYKLGFIAVEEEVSEGKVDFSDDAGSLSELYRTDLQKYVDYNIQDVNLIRLIDKKLGLLPMVFYMSYYSLSNYEDTIGTVKLWENIVARYLFNNGMVPLYSQLPTESREYEGAFVKEVVVGLHKWVFSVDLNSLYPHVEMQWNIGPETLIPYDELPQDLKDIADKYTFEDLLYKRADLSALKTHNVTMTANFKFYRKDKASFFSSIKREQYSERKVQKKKMIEAEKNSIKATTESEIQMYKNLESFFNSAQMGFKNILNAGYGAGGNESFLYYLVDNAEAITLSGQLVNKWTMSALEKMLKVGFRTNDQLWIAGDTDSGYITLDKYVSTLGDISTQEKIDAVDAFIKEIVSPFIVDKCQELCDYLNCYEQKMVWEREVIAESAIWVAKKFYCMSVWDSEGVRYNEPELVIKGLAAKKSSYPKWARELLKEGYRICLTAPESELHSRLDGVKKEFYSYSPERIANPKGINGIEKYLPEDFDGTTYKKGTPSHVKGAILHNHLVDKLGLTHVRKIVSGSKIKILNLRTPNPLRAEVICFESKLPKEFGVEKYIDKRSIYEVSFMSPMRSVLEAINWTEEEIIRP